jgi:hypothetical protein
MRLIYVRLFFRRTGPQRSKLLGHPELEAHAAILRAPNPRRRGPRYSSRQFMKLCFAQHSGGQRNKKLMPLPWEQTPTPQSVACPLRTPRPNRRPLLQSSSSGEHCPSVLHVAFRHLGQAPQCRRCCSLAHASAPERPGRGVLYQLAMLIAEATGGATRTWSLQRCSMMRSRIARFQRS